MRLCECKDSSQFWKWSCKIQGFNSFSVIQSSSGKWTYSCVCDTSFCHSIPWHLVSWLSPGSTTDFLFLARCCSFDFDFYSSSGHYSCWKQQQGVGPGVWMPQWHRDHLPVCVPPTPETGQQRQFCLLFSIKFEVALDPMVEDSHVWQLTEHETEGKNMMKRGISICSWEVLATDGLFPLTWTESSPANIFICQYIWLGRDPLILGEIDLQKPWVYLK